MTKRRRPPDDRALVMSGGRQIPRTPSPPLGKPRPRPTDANVSPELAKAAGELGELARQISLCAACSRADDHRTYGSGFPKAPVMLVKPTGSVRDAESSAAFTDEADPLGRAFDALGIPIAWIYGATAVRCGSTDPSDDEVDACAVHLLTEIEAVSPRVIVAFGPRTGAALRALHGRCGLAVPDDLPSGEPVALRPGLVAMVTEALPEGLEDREAKKRLWRDLRLLPDLLA